MWKHWVAPGLLATKLSRDEISNREVAYFIMGNFLLGTVVYYSGLTWANQPWTALSLWEALLVIVIAVFGMIHCFEAAGGDANSHFAAQFNCLTFPISLWTTVIAWSLFWLSAWAYRKWATSLVSPNSDVADLYVHLLGRFGWFITTATIVGAQSMFFLRMKNMLRKVADGGH